MNNGLAEPVDHQVLTNRLLDILRKDDYEPSNTEDNALEIILQETGKVFAGVLEDAGVYQNTAEGKAAFRRFSNYVNQIG